MRKGICLLLALVLIVGIVGCSAVGDMAGEVANAAVKELESQMKQTLDKYKVELVEMKSAFGRLNDEGGKLQLFCAVLVKGETEAMVQSCVTALGAVFEESAMAVQTQSKVENPHLVHKELSFDHSDFSDGTYYIVYGYSNSLTGDLLSKNEK